MGTFGGGLAVGMSMVQPSGGGGAAPAEPPLYILVNSFVPPNYPAKTSAVYQTFTTVVTVDP